MVVQGPGSSGGVAAAGKICQRSHATLGCFELTCVCLLRLDDELRESCPLTDFHFFRQLRHQKANASKIYFEDGKFLSPDCPFLTIF